MLELYLGLVPGEAPIDRLVDGAIADPTDQIVGDPITGAIVGIVPADHAEVDPGDRGGLWRRMRTRWTSAQGSAGAARA
jgi:hypothetical protein